MNQSNFRWSLALSLILSMIVGTYWAELFSLSKNTIQQNGNWQSTKMKLKKGVVASVQYFTDLHALSNQRLDLSKWHGHQEIGIIRDYNFDEVNISFEIHRNAYLDLLFGSDKDERYGLRISRLKSHPSQVFILNKYYQFVKSQEIDSDLINIKNENQISIKYANGLLSLKMNNIELGAPNFAWKLNSPLSLRGSFYPVIIEKVELKQNGQIVFTENFASKKSLLDALLIIMLSITTTVILVFLTKKKNNMSFLYGEIALKLTLLISTILFDQFVFENLTSRYLVQKNMHLGHKLFQLNALDDVKKNIQKQIEKKSDAPRILFLGGSQTWGAGSRFNPPFAKQVCENYLKQYLCINAGISSAETNLFIENIEYFKSLHPKIVVLNFGTNDKQKDQLKENLSFLIKTFKAIDSKIYVITEPNSGEWIDHFNHYHLDKLSAVKAAAQEEKVFLIDAQSRIHEWQSQGILWWDFVHLTDFGQIKMAELISREIRP
ncbi:MAG: hypothetical protein Fur0010_10460 [Bdellovibrio sp.]